MILTDAGPLIALIDRGEPDHDACVACVSRFSGPMLTTWPAFTEAMYLLGEAGGWRAQDALWSLSGRRRSGNCPTRDNSTSAHAGINGEV